MISKLKSCFPAETKATAYLLPTVTSYSRVSGEITEGNAGLQWTTATLPEQHSRDYG